MSILLFWRGRRFTASVSGAITPSGSFSSIKAALLAVAGAITPAGQLLSRSVGKALSGAITPTSTLIRRISRSLSGSLGSSGSLRWTFLKSFTGSIAPIGSLLKQTRKRLSGSIPSSGSTSALIIALLSRIRDLIDKLLTRDYTVEQLGPFNTTLLLTQPYSTIPLTFYEVNCLTLPSEDTKI